MSGHRIMAENLLRVTAYKTTDKIATDERKQRFYRLYVTNRLLHHGNDETLSKFQARISQLSSTAQIISP